jgi:hypothetical protein
VIGFGSIPGENLGVFVLVVKDHRGVINGGERCPTALAELFLGTALRSAGRANFQKAARISSVNRRAPIT